MRLSVDAKDKFQPDPFIFADDGRFYIYVTNNGEPNAKAVIYGFTEMLNEGIDIDNEENGTDEKPLTLKQVGRMITEIGLQNATKKLNETVIDSTKSEEKNV